MSSLPSTGTEMTSPTSSPPDQSSSSAAGQHSTISSPSTPSSAPATLGIPFPSSFTDNSWTPKSDQEDMVSAPSTPSSALAMPATPSSTLTPSSTSATASPGSQKQLHYPAAMESSMLASLKSPSPLSPTPEKESTPVSDPANPRPAPAQSEPHNSATNSNSNEKLVQSQDDQEKFLELLNAFCNKEESVFDRIQACDGLNKSLTIGGWLFFDEKMKVNTRQALLGLLAYTDLSIRQAAASTVSKIIGLEVNDEARRLLMQLVNNINKQSEDRLIHGSIKGLFYVCEREDCEPFDDGVVGDIVIVIPECVARLGYTFESRMAAAYALGSAFKVSRENHQKNYILYRLTEEVSRKAAFYHFLNEADANDLKIACLTSLIEIGYIYDQVLISNLSLFIELTKKLVYESDESLVIMLSTLMLEFWAAIAEIEVDILKGRSEGPCYHLMSKVSQLLDPIIRRAFLIKRLARTCREYFEFVEPLLELER